ncbi:MAG: DNA topoisomerase I [Nitrosopumilus sp. H8]|nr:MAG: DNA topoisomerase I [Nitrosopumilus sp. H8]
MNLTQQQKPRWKTLQHNGIRFPEEYEPRGIKVKIRNQKVNLKPIQEEMVYQWAKKKDTPYVQDTTFQKNFTADFAKAMGPGFKGISYKDIDFSDAYRIVNDEKSAKESMKKEDRKKTAARKKKEREKMKAKYGIAVMDGKDVEVGNYMAEPPGIFIGRGEHPLRGKWKPRITQGDVILNLGKGAKVPDGKWEKIVHNRTATWLASWEDYLTKKTKYIWLADTAGVKQDRDREKYDKATRLAKEIEKIKDRIVNDMKRNDEKSRIATACYLIFRTAMRVGDEKDSDEADTVGATTLRKEHVKLTGGAIEFDFLGKDSVRWKETIAAEGHDKQFHTNLEKLTKKKKPKDEIFDGIRSRHVNAYYSGIVKGLSAKVFRTYLATSVVKEYLVGHDDIRDKTANEKLYHAKLANLEAAKMCNHKRTIPKTFEQALEKKRNTLKDVQKTKPTLKSTETLKKAKASKTKTDKQKKSKRERIKRINEQIKKQEQRHLERIERLRLQIDLSERTRDYNLGTSLRNYIDPRVVMAWTDEVGAQWEKLYTAALQKKFLWVKNEQVTWKSIRHD